MAYLSLYRKYRSQTFGEVAGQEHVTTVLQNAIKSGRVAHAYLFCGPRGCGKTSSARLLARALNCENGPTPEPCGICSLCMRIREGNCLDVTELDAASETGIDDVREKIIENAKFAPTEARYKVYIIDEVHDLSQKAFDSLLKTIEEPPAHVIFILATTEAHKVPITIRSRCQRMDFRRGALRDLAENLRRVLDAEGLQYEQEAVMAVARAAEGSFRDSLSLLEQTLAYTDGNLTSDAVHSALGAIGPEALDAVMEAVASDDLASAYRIAGELMDSGKDAKQTIAALQSHVRDLMVVSISPSPDALPDASPERIAIMRAQAAKFTPDQMLQILRVLAETERDLRFTNQHRLAMELALWSILPSRLAAATAPASRAVQATTTYKPVAAPSPARTTPPPAYHTQPAERSNVSAPPPRQNAPAAESAPTAPPPRAASVGADTTVDIGVIRRLWPRVRDRVVGRYPTAASYIGSDVYIANLRGMVIELAFPDEFRRQSADKPARREAIEKAIAEELARPGYKIQCVSGQAPPEPGVPVDMAMAMDDHHAPPVPMSSGSNGTSNSDHYEDEYIELVRETLGCVPASGLDDGITYH
jgi:DNA polymerase-3 subunit gamma/tau